MKRQKFFIISILFTILYLFLMSFIVISGEERFNTFENLYSILLSEISLLILPIILSIIGISNISNEYKNEILKNIKVIPISPLNYIISKFIVFEVISVVFMVFVFTVIILIGLFSRFRVDMNFIIIAKFLYICIITSIIKPIVVFPIYAFTILVKGNSSISNLIGVIYIFFSFILGVKFKGITPLSSSNPLIFYLSFDNATLNRMGVSTSSIFMFTLEIVIVFLISMFLGVKALEKQEL